MRKQHSYYVYIITNPNKTVLYVGVTNNLARRLVEHYANKGIRKTFAGRYYAYSLIYYEHFKYINQAIAREKEIKKWNRQRKEILIASKNPDWEFYNKTFCGEWPPRKTWGDYLKKFKQQKVIEEESTICIYEEDDKKFLSKIKDQPSISNNLPSNTIAIAQSLVNPPTLSKRELFLIKIALLITLNQQEELKVLLQEISKNRVAKEDIEAVLVQVGVHAGFSVIRGMLEKHASFFDDYK